MDFTRPPDPTFKEKPDPDPTFMEKPDPDPTFMEKPDPDPTCEKNRIWIQIRILLELT